MLVISTATITTSAVIVSTSTATWTGETIITSVPTRTGEIIIVTSTASSRTREIVISARSGFLPVSNDFPELWLLLLEKFQFSGGGMNSSCSLNNDFTFFPKQDEPHHLNHKNTLDCIEIQILFNSWLFHLFKIEFIRGTFIIFFGRFRIFSSFSLEGSLEVFLVFLVFGFLENEKSSSSKSSSSKSTPSFLVLLHYHHNYCRSSYRFHLNRNSHKAVFGLQWTYHKRSSNCSKSLRTSSRSANGTHFL